MVNLNCTKSFLFDLKCTNIASGWGSAPDPTEGAYSAPPDPLSIRGEGRAWQGRPGAGQGRGWQGRAGEGNCDFAPLPQLLGYATVAPIHRFLRGAKKFFLVGKILYHKNNSFLRRHAKCHVSAPPIEVNSCTKRY